MRILLITSLVGTATPPPPTIPELVIARDLVRRGHETTWITEVDGTLATALRELGARVLARKYASKGRSIWRRVSRSLGAPSLARGLRDVDCVVSFRLSSTLLAKDLADRIGVPCMTFLHGYSSRGEKYVKHRCSDVDIVAAVSQAALDSYEVGSRGHRAPTQRLELIRNGIDDDAFRRRGEEEDARELWNIPRDVKLVGIVGTSRRKGCDLFLDAAARLVDKHADAHFMICGLPQPEPAQQELLARVKRVNAEDRVHWVGWQYNIAAYMRASDIWAMPSREDAFPLVGLEVAAMGRPLVAAAAGGIPEMMLDGETGFIVPIGDSQALTDRLDRLLGDAELRERMGTAAREFVRRELSLRSQVDRFEECIQLLAGCRNPSLRPVES